MSWLTLPVNYHIIFAERSPLNFDISLRKEMNINEWEA